ncbi:MAG TPA: glucokinase [Sphingobium sp.]|uniref:glucokinase n=1 Tax=Sphingobium sp. TaxID=1912891 RepID=UPI002ED47CDA
MTELVTLDIGGTNARFALAEVEEGRVRSLAEPVTLATADHATFRTAWEHFAQLAGRDLPRAVAIAIAGPVQGDTIHFTNNPWVIRPSTLDAEIGVDRFKLVNDFEAVGHAVAQADDGDFTTLSGPDIPLPETGTISIVGPGTGLGVAHVWRDGDDYRVQATEGGHIDFGPIDPIEDSILSRLRKKYRRVSAERVVSGPGIVDIYEALAVIEGRAVQLRDDKTIWRTGMEGTDSLAAASIERFCLMLGSVAGSIALAQGGSSVVIAGGLGQRIKGNILRSGFADRFRAKGRFESMMAAMPVKLITHPQPGLFGAAAAFARDFA